jgi:hypothetical protein
VNSDVARGCERYGALLSDGSTFSHRTIEDLLDSNVLPTPLTAKLRGRYLPAG